MLAPALPPVDLNVGAAGLPECPSERYTVGGLLARTHLAFCMSVTGVTTLDAELLEVSILCSSFIGLNRLLTTSLGSG